MITTCIKLGIDLKWADDQYWITLVNVIRELTKEGTKKKKVNGSSIGKFIKD